MMKLEYHSLSNFEHNRQFLSLIALLLYFYTTILAILINSVPDLQYWICIAMDMV